MPTASAVTAPKVAPPASTSACLIGAASQRLVTHLNQGAALASVMTKVCASGAATPRPSRNVLTAVEFFASTLEYALAPLIASKYDSYGAATVGSRMRL